MLKYLYCFCAIFRYFVSNEKSLSENEAQAGGIPGKFFRSDFSKPAEKDGAVQDRRRGGKDMNWTDEQREAITVRGSDILVSAAAGPERRLFDRTHQTTDPAGRYFGG